MNDARLLVIDDDSAVRDSIRRMAEHLGYAVETVDSARAFLAALETFHPTDVMIDIVMPEVCGVELLKLLARKGCSARVTMITGYRHSYLAKAVGLGRGLGLSDVTGLLKPLGLGDIKRVLSPISSATTEPHSSLGLPAGAG